MNAETTQKVDAGQYNVRVEGASLAFDQAVLTPNPTAEAPEQVVDFPEGEDDRLFEAMQNEVLMRHLNGGVPV